MCIDVNTYMRYDATGLADLIANKEVTAQELLTCAMRRSEAVNPQINAMVYPKFERATQSIEAGLAPGPFAGVPFPLKMVKCNFCLTRHRQNGRLTHD